MEPTIAELLEAIRQVKHLIEHSRNQALISPEEIHRASHAARAKRYAERLETLREMLIHQQSVEALK